MPVTTPPPLLKLGSNGKRVLELEKRLKTLGYLKAQPDTSFDAKTKEAVLAYKKKQGWNPAPVVGERMTKALKADVFEASQNQTPSKMRGATYNCLVGRNPATVAKFVHAMAKKQNLDFIQLQEMQGYDQAFRKIPGYKLITFPKALDHGETGVLVREGIATENAKSIQSTVGYQRKGGAPVPGRAATAVKLAGWLNVVSLHAPPAINWINGHAVGPAQRIKSYGDLMQKLLGYSQRQQKNHPKDGLLLGGDWNEGAVSTGKWSPSWLANLAHMKKFKSGRIDWEMARRANVTKVHNGPTGGSDHRMVTFTVTRPGK